jgi:hypothetical protein
MRNMRLIAGSLILFGCFSISSITSHAQMAGNKAVYDASGNCSPCLSSTATVDASVVNGSDVCQKIYNALQSIPAGPKVVDARGINSNLTCTGTETPWLKSGINAIVASTILLPARTITISSPWILPDGTRLIGQGTGTANTVQTVLQAPLNFSGTMIKMGDNVYCPAAGHICHGISIEDLILDGGGQGVGGILNTNSQELSYVNHVKLYQIMGIGLSVSTSAQNSGPYTNITFDTGNLAPTLSTGCAQISGLTGTRGIHGLTCISSTISPAAAVYLDSSNNSIEDVLIEGFTDGIRVGSQGAARSNILFNIDGDTSQITATQAPATIAVIHISVNFPVADLSMMGIRNTGGGSFTIKDDLTTTTLNDPSLAMYVLGKLGRGNTGYSRFTTSPNAASWSIGSGSPTSSTCAAQNRGSLYSNIGTSGSLLWVCETNGWQNVK